VMGMEVAVRRGRRRIELQDKESASVIAGEEVAVVKRQRAHATAMSLEGGATTAVQSKALNRIVLRSSKDEAPARIKSAAQERTVVPQLLHHARASRIDLPRTLRPSEPAIWRHRILFSNYASTS